MSPLFRDPAALDHVSKAAIDVVPRDISRVFLNLENKVC
jgi:hypothetical protein